MVRSGGYATAKRLALLRGRLNDRQWSVLRDVARLGVLCGGQLRHLHYGEDQSARRLARLDLAGLVESGALGRLGRRIGGVHAGSDGYCYSLGVAGQRLVYPDQRRYRRPWTPGASFLNHALAVSQLYVDLRVAERSGDFSLVRFDAEPACWRRFFGPGGSRRWLKPDAYVVIDSGEFRDRVFVEIDRGSESRVRIVDKAKAYIGYYQSGKEQADDGVFPVVVFVTPTDERREQVVEGLARVPAEHWRLFVVITEADAARKLSDGSLVAGDPAEEAP